MKREGGKETNYYLVPGYTCSFEKSRHSRRNDHAFYSSFQPFSISSPFDIQSSPLSLRSGYTTVPNRFASLDRRRRSRVDGATFRVFTRRKCPLTSPYPYIHDGSVSKVSIKGLIHASHKFRPESRIDLSLFVAPFLALEY